MSYSYLPIKNNLITIFNIRIEFKMHKTIKQQSEICHRMQQTIITIFQYS